MKWLFVLALLAIGAVSAETVLEDPQDDVEATITNWNGPVDLMGLDLEETEDNIIFRLTVQDVSSSPELVVWTSVQYSIDMDYGDNAWELRLFRSTGFDNSVQWGGNLRQTNAEGFQFGRGVQVEVEGNTLVATVPRGALVNEDDQQLSRSRTLDNIKVQSAARQFNFGDQRPLEASDLMPDDQVGAVWESLLGPRQEGPAVLWSDKPFRASNGEETTYAFEVRLESSEARQMDLRVANVPAGWNVMLPVSSANSADNTTIPVLAQVPFRHAHGETETFSLIAENGEDYTELQMGVQYLDPAEISGHHNTAYLHTMPGGEFNLNDVVVLDFTYGLLTTEMTNDQALDAPVQSNGGSMICGPDNSLTCERFYYYAPLYNGFDANVDEQGTFDFQADFPITALEAEAFVTIRHQSYDGDYTEEIIFEGTSGPVGQSSGVTDFSVVLDALAYADRIDVARSQAMELEIELRYQAPQFPVQLGDETPLRVGITAGELTLPLNDYHDDVSAFFDGIPSLNVHVPADTQTVNDGETRLFPVHLENIGSTDLELHMVLEGDWAELLADETVKIGTGESVEVNVAMRPVDTKNGDQSDAILTIHGEDTQEIVTLRAIVTDQDVPDDAELASELEVQETPWPAVLIPLALVVGWPRRQER